MSNYDSKKRKSNHTMEDMLCCDDLVGLILRSVTISPTSFVSITRVCKQWREVCLSDASFLLRAVATQRYLTKGVVMGIFGLTSEEANRLPHEVVPRYKGGVQYRYSGAIAIEALHLAGGVLGWQSRLKRRVADQVSIEAAFGREWRKLQWKCTVKTTKSNQKERGRPIEGYIQDSI
jgi:hypothetical protein